MSLAAMRLCQEYEVGKRLWNESGGKVDNKENEKVSHGEAC